MGVGRSDLAEGIRRHGFRKWYERTLISSHVHLVLTVLCVIGMFAAFEVFDRAASTLDQLTDVVAILLCASIGLWALRRYLFLLMRAEATANQAVCPVCQSYGRFDVAAEPPARDDGPLTVRCRKCSHRWPIDG
jgi:hypothetical protein